MFTEAQLTEWEKQAAGDGLSYVSTVALVSAAREVIELRAWKEAAEALDWKGRFQEEVYRGNEAQARIAELEQLLSAERLRTEELQAQRAQVAKEWRKQRDWMAAEPYALDPRASGMLDRLLENVK